MRMYPDVVSFRSSFFVESRCSPPERSRPIGRLARSYRGSVRHLGSQVPANLASAQSASRQARRFRNSSGNTFRALRMQT